MRYEEIDLNVVRKMGEEGYTVTRIADTLKVSRKTIYKWIESHEEFAEALKAGRSVAVQNIYNAAMRLACGYTETVKKNMKIKQRIVSPDGSIKEQEKIEAYYDEVSHSPDTGMIIFLLKNLDKERQWSNEPSDLEIKREKLKLAKEMSGTYDEEDDPHAD